MALTLTLARQDNSTGVPDWLNLKGLSLIGTPPEKLTNREIPLLIIVSNEYQSTPVEFTLNIGISWMYAFKLVTTYGGALVALLGIFVFARKVYNIVCKRWYRYPKDFTVRAGEEISPSIIYPIAFISDAMVESRYILLRLDKKIGKELNIRSKAKIASYFADSSTCQLDQNKLIQTVADIVTEILGDTPNKLKLYKLEGNSRKELINQLIINELTLRLLDLKETRSIQSY